MFSSRLFWRVFAAYAALLLLSAGVFAAALSMRIRADVEEQLDAGERIASVQRLIWGAGAAVGVGLLVVTWIVIRRIIRPLETFTAAARAIAAGEYRQEVPSSSGDELGALARAFNAMSRELAERIDELQQSREQLAESSRLLETVLGSMSDGVLVIDSERKLLYANAAAGALLKFASSPHPGRRLWEAVRHPELQRLVEEALQETGDGRQEAGDRGQGSDVGGQTHDSQVTTQGPLTTHHSPLTRECVFPRTNRTALVLANALPGEPCPGAVVVLHDMTELRRLENTRRQFVSNVSHELKTPLAAIQASAETLLAGAVDDARHNRRFLRQIEEQAERLNELILDLLRLARIESEPEALEIAPVRLADAARACAEAHAAEAAAKDIELSVHAGEDNVVVLADEEGLRTILDNLVQNAIHYTPAGGRVSINWHARDAQAVLTVSDTGIGIPREHADRIFERFYRVDKARSREHGGTGLGLSIVKHLALAFGGSVSVESEPGRGSSFTVVLPRAS